MFRDLSPSTCKRASRRAFLQTTAAAGLSSLLSSRLQAAATEAAEGGAAPKVPGASVGSLYQFIQSQAVKGEFPLSYLNPRFRSLRSWKKAARGKLLELLHYAPGKVEPKPEIMERVDCGEYIREKIHFNTTPDVRVPAIVLVPKEGPKRAPAIVALHDHGAFYLWGKEKLVKLEEENPALGDFRQQYYGERCIANELVRQG